MTLEQVFQILTAQKVYSDGAWHAYDEYGQEIFNAIDATAPMGILWRANPGALIMWPRFDDAQKPDVIPYAPGGMVFPKKKQRKRDRDDDVLMFLLR